MWFCYAKKFSLFDLTNTLVYTPMNIYTLEELNPHRVRIYSQGIAHENYNHPI
jgi:hypothetical protein